MALGALGGEAISQRGQVRDGLCEQQRLTQLPTEVWTMVQKSHGYY